MVLVVAPLQRKLGAQQGHPPVMTEAWTKNEQRLDLSLPWMSEYAQPFIYQVWWSEIANCEGIPFNPDQTSKVQFFQVNGPDFIPGHTVAIVYAVTYGEAFDGQVYVAEPYIWNKALVEHEMVHMLLKLAGDPRWDIHDPKLFERCGITTFGPPLPNK